MPAELRAGRCVDMQSMFHHQLFDCVPHLAVFRIFHKHRIGHFPIHDPPLELLGQEEAGHIDHQIEIRAPQMTQTFRKMIPQIDTPLLHQADGIGSYRGGRRQADAGRNHDVAAERARESLRHLAAAGIADTDKQHTLLMRRSHSFSRNRLWTRTSLVSSGWKVATRCSPCSTSTASPAYSASTWTPAPAPRIIGARMNTASSLPGDVRCSNSGDGSSSTTRLSSCR